MVDANDGSLLGDSTRAAMPARPEPGPRVSVRFHGVTDPGKVRERNEDQFLIARLTRAMDVRAASLPGGDEVLDAEGEGYLIIVADGMGGAAAGERASALAVESVEAFVQDTLKWFLHLGGREEHELFDELRACLHRADLALFDEAASHPDLHGMGTTLTMSYSVADDLYIVHAGDSRAYLFREGQLEQVTTDHTYVQSLIEAGMLTTEQARHHHRRHVVMNVLGGPSEGVDAEIHKVKLVDGDVFLFCSDGLTEVVSDELMAGVLDELEDPREAAETLLRLALDGGGPDNITVVVARYQVDR